MNKPHQVQVRQFMNTFQKRERQFMSCQLPAHHARTKSKSSQVEKCRRSTPQPKPTAPPCHQQHKRSNRHHPLNNYCRRNNMNFIDTHRSHISVFSYGHSCSHCLSSSPRDGCTIPPSSLEIGTQSLPKTKPTANGAEKDCAILSDLHWASPLWQ